MTAGYDTLGRLAEYNTSISTRFLYDGDRVTAELDNQGAVNPVKRRYIWGAGEDELVAWYEGTGSATRRFPMQDERASIVAVSDSAGALVGINRYDEYGIPATTNIGRFQYTGQAFLAEAGLYHYKARAYSPTLGRFMQTDPIGYKDGINWYDYVDGDPVSRVDPTGLLFDVTLLPSLAEAGGAVIEGVRTASAVIAVATVAIPAIIINLAIVTPAGIPNEADFIIEAEKRNMPPIPTTMGGRGNPQAPGERRQAGKPSGTPKEDKKVNPNDGTRKDNQSGKTIRPAPQRPAPPQEPERVPRTRREKRKGNSGDD